MMKRKEVDKNYVPLVLEQVAQEMGFTPIPGIALDALKERISGSLSSIDRKHLPAQQRAIAARAIHEARALAFEKAKARYLDTNLKDLSKFTGRSYAINPDLFLWDTSDYGRLPRGSLEKKLFSFPKLFYGSNDLLAYVKEYSTITSYEDSVVSWELSTGRVNSSIFETVTSLVPSPEFFEALAWVCQTSLKFCSGNWLAAAVLLLEDVGYCPLGTYADHIEWTRPVVKRYLSTGIPVERYGKIFEIPPEYFTRYYDVLVQGWDRFCLAACFSLASKEQWVDEVFLFVTTPGLFDPAAEPMMTNTNPVHLAWELGNIYRLVPQIKPIIDAYTLTGEEAKAKVLQYGGFPDKLISALKIWVEPMPKLTPELKEIWFKRLRTEKIDSQKVDHPNATREIYATTHVDTLLRMIGGQYMLSREGTNYIAKNLHPVILDEIVQHFPARDAARLQFCRSGEFYLRDFEFFWMHSISEISEKQLGYFVTQKKYTDDVISWLAQYAVHYSPNFGERWFRPNIDNEYASGRASTISFGSNMFGSILTASDHSKPAAPEAPSVSSSKSSVYDAYANAFNLDHGSAEEEYIEPIFRLDEYTSDVRYWGRPLIAKRGIG
jgi:hypothetical protein